MAYYHVYTKGLEDRLLYRDRDDFIAGMNMVAIVCFSVDVKLLAFVLMSNHLHFVVLGSKEKVDKFIWLYKNLLSRYLKGKYGDVKFLRHLETSVSLVDNVGDNLKRLIAYVLNNPVKAGINCVPQGYEWSSARCYFNATDSSTDTVFIGSLGTEEARRILRSKKRLPAHWRLNSSGYIIPESYIDIDSVERCFVRSRSFEYFLSSSLSAKKGLSENIAFSDSVLKMALSELLEKKYEVSHVGQMDDFLKKHMLRDLKSRFGTPVQQLARVVEMSVSDVLRLLE